MLLNSTGELMDLNFFTHEKHMNWWILGQNIVYVNGCYFKLKHVIFFYYLLFTYLFIITIKIHKTIQVNVKFTEIIMSIIICYLP